MLRSLHPTAQRFRLLGLILPMFIFVAGSNVARGQALKLEEEPKTEEKEASISEEDVQVGDVPPDQLMDIIDLAARTFSGQETSKRKKAEQVFIIAKAADKVRARPDATPRERELAEVLKITYLNYGAQLDETIFGEQLSKSIDDILQNSPKSKAAPLAAAYRVMRLWTGTNKEKDKNFYLPQLVEFHAKFPDNLIGIQLFDLYAGKLLSENRTKEAQAVYDKAMSLYEKHPAMPAMRDGYDRLQKLLSNIGASMDYSMVSEEESEFDPATLKEKVVIVQFWATTSPFCRVELENVRKAYDKYHTRGLEVIGVPLDESDSSIQEFVEQEKIPWQQLVSRNPSLLGPKHPIASRYNVTALPMIFVVDQQGKIANIGIRGADAIDEAVAKLLGPEKKKKKPGINPKSL
ncbi:MAG: TlpA disulfide reductase family protein [Planctomycetota bacterium]